uniref:Genome polyprotein n=1 Tax=Wenling rattails calicivirus 1 TaxID=2116388 RepID=A0A2P1GMJ6_9CALI|nr:polyprotein [Wenling rattails calicivirus 1]
MAVSKYSMETLLSVVKPINLLDIVTDAYRHQDVIGVVNSLVRLLELYNVLYGGPAWTYLYTKITQLIRYAWEGVKNWSKPKSKLRINAIKCGAETTLMKAFMGSLTNCAPTERDQAQVVMCVFEDSKDLAADLQRALALKLGQNVIAVVLTTDKDHVPGPESEGFAGYYSVSYATVGATVVVDPEDCAKMEALIAKQKSQLADGEQGPEEQTWTHWAGEIFDQVLGCGKWLRDASKHVIVKLVTAVIVGCTALAGLAGQTNVGAKVAGFGKGIVNTLKNLGTTKEMLPSIIDAAADLACGIAGTPDMSTKGQLVLRLQDIDKEIEGMISDLTVKRPITMCTPSQLHNLEDRMNKISLELAPGKENGGSLTNAICAVRARFVVLKELVFNVQQKLGFRMKPTVVVLAGPPGVGKTTFVKTLVAALQEELKGSRQDQITFGVDHMDGYAGHPVCVADEFGAKDLKNDAAVLQQWADDTPVTLDCDRLENKGSQFCAQIIIVNTNHENIYKECPFPMAMARRVDFHLFATNPAYLRWRTTNPSARATDDELAVIHGNNFEMYSLPHAATNWKGSYMAGGLTQSGPTAKITAQKLTEQVLNMWRQRRETYMKRLLDAGVGETPISQMIEAPIYVLKGAAGTGKSTMASQLDATKYHIKDDVAFTSATFDSFLNLINQNENGEVDPKPIIATCNGDSWDECLEELDPDKQKAVLRRCVFFTFSFQRKSLLSWYKAGDVTGENLSTTVRIHGPDGVTNAADLLTTLKALAVVDKPLFDCVVPTCPITKPVDVTLTVGLAEFVQAGKFTQYNATTIHKRKQDVMTFVTTLLAQVPLEASNYLSTDSVIVTANKSGILWTGDDIVVETPDARLCFTNLNNKLCVIKDGPENFTCVDGVYVFHPGSTSVVTPPQIDPNLVRKTCTDWGADVRAGLLAITALVNAGFCVAKDVTHSQWNFLTDAEYDAEVKKGAIRRRATESRYDAPDFDPQREYKEEPAEPGSWANESWEREVDYNEMVFQHGVHSLSKSILPVFDALGSKISSAVVARGNVLVNRHALPHITRIGHKALGECTVATVPNTDLAVIKPKSGTWTGMTDIWDGPLVPQEPVIMLRPTGPQQFRLSDTSSTLVVTDTGSWRLHKTMKRLGDSPTVRGDCGCPYFVIRNGKPYLIGIHSAGNSTVASFARIPGSFLVREPQKSQMREERVFGKTHLARHPLHTNDTTYQPAVMGKGDPRCPNDRTTDEIINDSVAPFLLEQPLPCHTPEVVEDVLGHMKKFVKRKCVVYSLETALANQDLTTSPGLPFTRLGLTKTDLVDRCGESNQLRPKHKEVFMREYQKLFDPDAGVEVLVALKDELRKLNKIQVGATRLIFCSPMHMNVFLFQHFGHLFSQLKASCWESGVSVGVSPSDGTWHAMYMHLRSNGGLPFVADFTRWDSTQATANVRLAMGILVELTGFGDSTKERLRMVIEKNLTPLMDLFPSPKRPNRGLLSGIFGTSQLNSILNLCYVSAALQKRGDMLAINNTQLRLCTYGDDIVVSVPKGSEDLVDTLTGVYSEFELKPTNPDKTGPPTTVPWSEATFLKRKFVTVNGIVMGCLERESVERQLEWLRTSSAASYSANPARISTAPDMVITAGIQNVMSESFIHGKVYYNTMRDSIIQRARNAKYRLQVHIPNYERFDVLHAMECAKRFCESDFSQEKQESQHLTMDTFNKLQDYCQTNYGVQPTCKHAPCEGGWEVTTTVPWGAFSSSGASKQTARAYAAAEALDQVRDGLSMMTPQPRVLDAGADWIARLHVVCATMGVGAPVYEEKRGQTFVTTIWTKHGVKGLGERARRLVAKMACDYLGHLGFGTYAVPEWCEMDPSPQTSQSDTAPPGMVSEQPVLSILAPTAGAETMVGSTGQVNGMDPTIYEQFIQTPTGDFTVSSNMVPGTDILVQDVTPNINVFTSFMQGIYNAWSGGFDVRFVAAANNFIGGKLILAILPPDITPDMVPGTAALTAFPYEIIDIRQVEPVDLTTPDIKNVLFHRVGATGPDGKACTLVIRVWSQLSVSTQDVVSVNCKLLSRPSANFAFSFLIPPGATREDPDAQKDILEMVAALNNPRVDCRFGIHVDSLLAVANDMQQLDQPLGGLVDLSGQAVVAANPIWPTFDYVVNYDIDDKGWTRWGWIGPDGKVWDPDSAGSKYSKSIPPWFTCVYESPDDDKPHTFSIDWNPDIRTFATNVSKNSTGNPVFGQPQPLKTSGQGVVHFHMSKISRFTGNIQWENNESLLVFTNIQDVKQEMWALSTARSIQSRGKRPWTTDNCILMQMRHRDTGITGVAVKLYPEGFMTVPGKSVNTIYEGAYDFEFVSLVSRRFIMGTMANAFQRQINDTGIPQTMRDMMIQFEKLKIRNGE